MCIRDSFRTALQLPAYFLQSSGYVTVPDPFQHPGNLPVSYTHLDVYKRQVRSRGAGDSSEEIGGDDIYHCHAAAHPSDAGAVSYTHLRSTARRSGTRSKRLTHRTRSGSPRFSTASPRTESPPPTSVTASRGTGRKPGSMW